MPRDTDVIAGATSSLRRRLYAKITKGPRRACWTWTGATVRKKDGVRRPALMVGGRRSRVVHVARLLLCLRDRVPLTERYMVHAGHLCHNPICVNVRHLAWQTQFENHALRDERRRAA